MDNKTISDLFNDVYNVWWMKWREKVIDRHDSVMWQQFYDEGHAIVIKYLNLDNSLAAHMITGLITVMEQRTCLKEQEDNSNDHT